MKLAAVYSIWNKKKISSFELLILILVICLPLIIKADGGYIPTSDVDVYGPGQKAIIAWNGTVESIILSEDAYATGDSTALKVIPLPSTPIYIEEGRTETFEKMSSLINSRRALYRIYVGESATETTADQEPSYEIIFYGKIKSHNITVIRVDNATRFLEEAELFLASLGYATQIPFENIESIVNQYMQNDIHYFVFDLVDLTTEITSIEPLAYTFNCNYLYYPMVISSTASGDTAITLFVLTESPLNNGEFPKGVDYGHFIYELPAIPTSFPTGATVTYATQSTTILRAMQFDISHEELQYLFSDMQNSSSRIPTFFSSGCWISVLTYEGALKSLNTDLIIKTMLTEWSTITQEITTTKLQTTRTVHSTAYFTPYNLIEGRTTTYTTTTGWDMTGTAYPPWHWIGVHTTTTVVVNGPTTITFSRLPLIEYLETTTQSHTTQTMDKIIVVPEFSNLLIPLIIVILLFTLIMLARRNIK
ncbi:DUF2330 domain-containing protein [[Eubacterium] cellulosolvens]